MTQDGVADLPASTLALTATESVQPCVAPFRADLTVARLCESCLVARATFRRINSDHVERDAATLVRRPLVYAVRTVLRRSCAALAAQHQLLQPRKEPRNDGGQPEVMHRVLISRVSGRSVGMG